MLQLCINSKIYTFSSENLNEICKGFITNESLLDEEEKWVLSFTPCSYVKKSYEDLDLHEFILDGTFRFSVLLCHIENIFGQEKTERFAERLGTTWNSTDYFDALGATEALSIAKELFDADGYQKFKALLASIYLFRAAHEDYEQGVTDFNEYNKTIVFINGNGYYKKNGKKYLWLVPMLQKNRTEYKNYILIGNICVPPFLIDSVFNTYPSENFDLNSFSKERLKLFILKIEQLGCFDLYNEYYKDQN